MFFARPRPASAPRARRRLQPLLHDLEDRVLLSVSAPQILVATSPAVIPGQTAPLYPWPSAAQEAMGAVTEVAGGGTNSPLTAVPALNSLPGAIASLYLDFNGNTTAIYGSYNPGTTPAYDQDGDPTTFSDGELASIRSIWAYVAEDYAPFNINVTTVQPANMGHGATEIVVIGGDGTWSGGRHGGLSYVNNFTMSGVPNIAYVFSKNLAGGNPRYTGDAASHEAGHGFGLEHQSTWINGTLTQEYSTGPGDGTAPIMGGSYGARRSLWWYGTSDDSATTYQDDMAILSGATNHFGYRTRAAVTTALLNVQAGGQASGSGLLVRTTDVDVYTFSSGAGSVSFTVTPPANIANLAPRVSILDSTGAVLATAGPGQDLSATVTVTLPAAGSYRVAVASNGGYGNVGHYTFSGSVVPVSNPGGGSGTGAGTNPGTGSGSSGTGSGVVSLDSPTGVTVRAVSPTRIDVSWSGISGAAGYLVTGSTDGVNWITMGGTTAAVTSFSDLFVAPGSTRSYRVYAVGRGVTSAASALASATAPPIPGPPTQVTALYLVSRAPRQIGLTWQPSTGTLLGYVIERSSNGRNWTAVGRTNGSPTSFLDNSVAPSRVYLYRVRSYNAWGTSSVSPVVRVATPRSPVVTLPRRR